MYRGRNFAQRPKKKKKRKAPRRDTRGDLIQFTVEMSDRLHRYADVHGIPLGAIDHILGLPKSSFSTTCRRLHDYGNTQITAKRWALFVALEEKPEAKFRVHGGRLYERAPGTEGGVWKLIDGEPWEPVTRGHLGATPFARLCQREGTTDPVDGFLELYTVERVARHNGMTFTAPQVTHREFRRLEGVAE